VSDVSIDFDVNQAVKNRQPAFSRAQAALDIQVIKDSNYFVPKDEGALESSALLSTDIGSGVVVWGADHARDQYYKYPNKSKDKNPNASIAWFEEAKRAFGEDWNEIAQAEIDGD